MINSNDKKNRETTKRFFKYKSILTTQDLDRILEIIKTNKIYFPKPSQLNDPFEARRYTFIPAVAGAILHTSAHKSHPIFDDWINKFKVLSLTRNCSNQVMWSMYASDYKGICLGFVDKGSFNDMIQIGYEDYRSEIIGEWELSNFSDEIVKNSLLVKKDFWSYEKEYRIIIENGEDFFEFLKEELNCVILGCKMSDNVKELIESYCTKREIDVYVTYIDQLENDIKIMTYDDYSNHVLPGKCGEELSKYFLKLD